MESKMKIVFRRLRGLVHLFVWCFFIVLPIEIFLVILKPVARFLDGVIAVARYKGKLNCDNPDWKLSYKSSWSELRQYMADVWDNMDAYYGKH